MEGRNRTPLIIGVVVAVLALVGGVYYFTRDGQSPVTQGSSPPAPVKTLNCIGGSEKSALMADPEVTKLLRDKYQLAVDFNRQGSYDLVQLPASELKAQKVDCLWPSSASARSVFEKSHNARTDFPGYRAESVLESPEVIYAGVDATDALVKAGVVEKRGGGYYIVDLKRLLLELVLKKQTWQSLGAQHVAGPVKITSTDPASSNSGFTLAQLELAVASSGDVYQPPTLAEARKGLATVRVLYESQGLQAESSDDGFREWLIQGAASLYAGYENQLLQKLVEYKGDANARQTLLTNVRLLYPEPTIYNSHPVLALNADAGRLIDAMKDPAVQSIAWKKYGFRSGTQIGANKAADFKEVPLADQLRTTAAPNADVTLLLIGCLRDNKCT
jgi:hypothetical protein